MIRDDRHRITIEPTGYSADVVVVTWVSRIEPTAREVEANAAAKLLDVGVDPQRPATWCHRRVVDYQSLIAGFWSPRMSAALDDPPLNVITRVVALAVEHYLKSEMNSAVRDIAIPLENR